MSSEVPASGSSSRSDSGSNSGGRQLVAYLSHGAPTAALEKDQYAEALQRLGQSIRPRAIVVAAESWRTPGSVRVSLAARHSNLRRFRGAPPALQGLSYQPPGDPVLAREIVELLKGAGFDTFPDQVRGLEPATWIPLLLAFPEADVPVVQISLPEGAKPDELLRLGEVLAPLRDRGILIMGGGGAGDGLDLRSLERKHAPVEPWALAFDDWLEQRLAALDRKALAGYRDSAPHAEEAVPTSIALDPLFFVLGATGEGDEVRSLYEGVHHGCLSMRSFTAGSA